MLRYCLVLGEEDVGNGEGGDDADEIGYQAASYGMAGVLDSYTAEVNCEYIESGIRGAL
jgi:hypothetical protein